ncbi:hypothetical protein V6N13_009133 [Hibiscus sabdariffa]
MQDYRQPSNYRTLENTLNTLMMQMSYYKARTDQFIQKTDAFMNRTEIDTEVAKGATHEQCKAISTRSGKILKPPTENKQGENIVANSKVASDTDIPSQADTPASIEEDHNILSESEKAEITTVASRPIQSKKDTPEEPRPPPPFAQTIKKQKQEYQFKKLFDILKQVHINLCCVL